MVRRADNDVWRLGHIIESIELIESFMNGIDKEKFEADYMLQSAVVRQFEIIGEATNNLSAGLIIRYEKYVNWAEVIGMRHKMIHDYFDVNLDVIWDTIQKDISILKTKINKIQKDLEKTNKDAVNLSV